MATPTITIPFNPEGMSLRDAKAALGAFRSVLQDFEKFGDDPAEFALRVAQIADRFKAD